ncbi:MAG: amidase [Planctomycetes bacterium]|nr:amidase [Planctomycetota bacterium]
MTKLKLPRLAVSPTPPYDPLQAFVRENHIALNGLGEGPLSDLVFAIKDVWEVMGSTVGNGHPSWLRSREPATRTSSIVTRLLEAGADLVGKTMCDELCFSISGENWHYGSPVNPWDTFRLAGGSSSGSAVAVAAGLVDFALGSDCLGSVRVPSAYNGLLGMRPTYQRVPGDGEAPFCASMDVVGFMADHPEIFKRVGKVLLGEDTVVSRPAKLLIAEDCFEAVNVDVREALQPAVKVVGNAVGSVEKIRLSKEGLDKWVASFQLVQGYEVWESYGGFIAKYRPQLYRGPRERLEWASGITLQQYKKALKDKDKIQKRLEEIVPPDTLLCLPTAASVALRKDTPLTEINTIRQQSTYLLCISPMSGTPQITLPLVLQHDLPLGLSLISAQGTDMRFCEFAADLLASAF